ncbi:E2 domain-containing protein [Ponticaulis sp.]|uniref:E2 domain-containing protein n=1 Tax=Ponticaulis sp. TaxID=2020902 RepID=UPI00342758D1
MTTPQEWLLCTAPNWIALRQESENTLIGQPKILAAPKEWSALRLKISCEQLPKVYEAERGQCLPKFCPERHINFDGSFCLGVDRTPVSDSVSAVSFWQALYSHLIFQASAAKRAVWPDSNAWDHGDAYRPQQEGEALAIRLGIEQDFLLAREGKPTWITDRNTVKENEQGEVIAVDHPCPAGCRQRSSSASQRPCEHSKDMIRLVQIERERRKLLIEFWELFREVSGCCGTMPNCPMAMSQEKFKECFSNYHN